MRLLQVTDDSALAQGAELMLKAEGFQIYTTDLGEEAVDLAKIYDYDCIILDLERVCGMSGADVLRKIRTAAVKTPVVILTRDADVETKVKALGAGADDLLTCPFHRDELVARLQAVARRFRGHAASAVTVGGLTVNLDAKTVTVDGARVHLTGKEYQILELLALRLGATLTKEMFLNHLYGGMDEPELKIIDVFICKVRRKLGHAGWTGIETVWGRGYVLRGEAPVEALAPPPVDPHLAEVMERLVGD